MKQLKNLIIYLLCVSIVLNFFPKFWHDLHTQLYYLIDILPSFLIGVAYLLYTKRFNKYYILGILLCLVGGLMSKYAPEYYDFIVVLYGLSLVAFILLAHHDIFKITTKSIVIFSIPFLIIIISIYLSFAADIEFIGKASMNFYALTLGFFLFFAGTRYYNRRSMPNLLYLFASVFIVLTAFINGYDLSKPSFNIERYVNIFYVSHHIFMLQYILLKEQTPILLKNIVRKNIIK